MNYRFTWPCPVFYPDVRDAEGKSLMALPDITVVDFPDGPPDDGKWVPAEDAPEAIQAGSEPAVEAAEPEPAPVVTPPAPEPAEAITEPSEPVPVTPPEQISVTPPAPEPPAPFSFPGLYRSPYTRT